MAKKVKRICMECAILCGKNENQVDPKVRYYKGKCGICGQTHAVCDSHWWGFFTPAQIETGMAEVKKLGLYVNQKANADDVRRLVDVVKGVLGDEFMSYETREVIKSIEEKLDSGQPIQLWDTKLLTTWYAADCVQMKYSKEVQEAENERLHPSPKLVVVEGGRETVRRVRKDTD